MQWRSQPINIGVAKELAEMEIASLVHSRLCLFSLNSKVISQLSCSGWCGESHTLPYPGYATAACDYLLLSLGLRFNISGDTQSLERRIIFENENSQFSREITANINVQSCTTINAYVQVCILYNNYSLIHAYHVLLCVCIILSLFRTLSLTSLILLSLK